MGFEGQKNVHNEAQSGRPSVVNDGLVRIVDGNIHDNRHTTLSVEFALMFCTKLLQTTLVIASCIPNGVKKMLNGVLKKPATLQCLDSLTGRGEEFF